MIVPRQETSSATSSTSSPYTSSTSRLTGWPMPAWGMNGPAGEGPESLSKGAIAGITIGTIVSLTVVIGIIYFILRYNKQKTRRESTTTLIGEETGHQRKYQYTGSGGGVGGGSARSSRSEPGYDGEEERKFDVSPSERTQRQDSSSTAAPAYSEDPIPLYTLHQPPSPRSSTRAV